MIKLSYSSITNLYNGHEWINKMLSIPVPDYSFLKDGREAHRIIQDHVSKKAKSEFLKHIEIYFPIVEEESDESDFKKYWEGKKKCKFSFPVKTAKNDYEISGYLDGLDPENKRFLEIKTSTNAWSMKQFSDSIQRKIYALAKSDFKEAYIITGSKNPTVWEKEPPKLYSMALTKKDRDEAMDWILGGIEILEKGNFKGGLDEEGYCKSCFWNMERYPELANCHFMRRV